MDDLKNRRDFLKSAGIAVAGALGAASFAAAQQQEEEEKTESEDREEELDYDALFAEDPGDEDTRACPQCGALMYRQGRTWTCENCGYSYVE